MADFAGYLIRATKNGVNFPNQFINVESYESTPKQREQIKAYRDDNTRDLTLITAKGKKSKITFQTVKGLRLADKKIIVDFLKDNYSNTDQRKINLRYWDDENNTYDVGDFYVPDITYPIKEITPDDIIYGEFKITFIEF